MSAERLAEILADAPEPARAEPVREQAMAPQQVVSQNEQPDFGAQLKALWREGLKDLHNAILPAFPDSQRGVEEPGTPLNPTPQQVTQDLGNVHSLKEILDAPSVAPITPAVEMERSQGREM